MVGYSQSWEPWEARRASLPKRASWEERDARESARLLLMVVNARLRDHSVEVQHVEALAQAAEDERLTAALRVRAAKALVECRMRAMGRGGGR